MSFGRAFDHAFVSTPARARPFRPFSRWAVTALRVKKHSCFEVLSDTTNFLVSHPMQFTVRTAAIFFDKSGNVAIPKIMGVADKLTRFLFF